jgi:hypothetical protein
MKELLEVLDPGPGGWHIGRFCSWLCGLNPNGFTSVEAPISENLPAGITIQEASAEQLGEALKSAINTSGDKTDAIVRFVFSQLAGGEAAKAEAVTRAVIPMISAKHFLDSSRPQPEHGRRWH